MMTARTRITTSGEKSNMPPFGRTFLIGARTGSVIATRSWPRAERRGGAGSTEEGRKRARKRSSNASSRNRRKLNRNTVPTASSLAGIAPPGWSLPGGAVAVRPAEAMVVIRTLPEQGAADPDERGALLDGNLEVVAHAHRQVGPESRLVASEGLGEGAERDERRPGGLRLVHEAAHGHEAPDLEAGQLEDGRQGRPQLGGPEAGLLRVGIDVDLQEDRQRSSGPQLRGESVE